MTRTEMLAQLLAKNAILRDEMAIRERVAGKELDETTALLAEAVEELYNNDMEVIDNV